MVAPPAITTLEVTETAELLLVNVTVTPVAGAAVGKEIANGVDWPRPRLTFIGMEIGPALTIFTVAVESAMFGRALACRTVEPSVRADTGSVTLVAPAANVAVGGTVATPALLELRLTVRPPAGAGADRLRVMFCVVRPLIVMEPGAKLTLAVVCTVWVPEVNPDADAVMLAEPMLTAVTVGCVVGVVAPAAMVTLAADTVTFVVSLLVKATVTPPAGAGTGRVTAYGMDWPIATEAFAGRPMVPALTTFTVAVVSGTFGEELPWITVEPMLTPVTGTLTVVVPAPKVTLAGTVAVLGLVDVRLMVKPPAGAAADRVRVRF